MKRTEKAQQMFLTLLPVHRKMAERKGKNWTVDDEEKLFIHCATVNHVKPESVSRLFYQDAGEPFPF